VKRPSGRRPWWLRLWLSAHYLADFSPNQSISDRWLLVNRQRSEIKRKIRRLCIDWFEAGQDFKKCFNLFDARIYFQKMIILASKS